MKVISLTQCKSLLGIASDETTHDTALESAITQIDKIVKLITKNRYNYQITGKTTLNSRYIEVYSIYDNNGSVIFEDGKYKYNFNDSIDMLYEFIDVGQMIDGDGIDTDSYIDEVYYNGSSVELDGTSYSVPTIKLNQNATATDSSAQLFLGINTGYHYLIARGVYWMSQRFDTTIRDETWKSKSMGPVSVTKSSVSERIDGRYGVPVWFVQGLPHYHGGHI